MDVFDGLRNLDDQAAALQEHWDRYDFFFLDYKYTEFCHRRQAINREKRDLAKGVSLVRL